MKIILEHDEFIALQEFARDPFNEKWNVYPNYYETGKWKAGDKRRPKVLNVKEVVKLSTPLSRCFDARLIDYDRMETLELTELGKQVLKEHSPWNVTENNYTDAKTGRLRYSIKV